MSSKELLNKINFSLNHYDKSLKTFYKKLKKYSIELAGQKANNLKIILKSENKNFKKI